MSRQLIVNEYNSPTLTPSANLLALTTMNPQEKERIKQSRLFSQSLFGRAGLLREIGASYDHSAVARAWAQNLSYEYGVTFSIGLNDFKSYFDLVTSMVYDKDTRSIIAGAQLTMLTKDSDGDLFRPIKREPVAPSKVTSIAVSPSRIMLVTLSGRGMLATLRFLHLDKIRDINPNRPLPYHERCRYNSEYWASSANPRHDICMFAIAGSDGTPVLKEGQSTWNITGSTPDPDTVALDWLNPDVLIKGRRFGAVKLWDMRTDDENARPRIQHATNINHVRCIDENIIAVAGLQGTLRTYDLRYAKPDCASQYFDCFPTYRNNTSLNYHFTRLDVHQNTLAAASDDRRVQILDVKKGVELSSGINNLFRNYSCVRFVDEQKSGEALKLMAAVGPRIEWWSFGGSTVRRQ